MKKQKEKEQKKECVFIDICRLHRKHMITCFNRNEAHVFCGYAREKIKDVRVLE